MKKQTELSQFTFDAAVKAALKRETASMQWII